MGILGKLQTVFRGDIPIYHLPHELLRRRTAARRLRTERTALDALNEETARLLPEFAKYSPEELLQHFQSDPRPSFRLNNSTQPERALGRADRIADHSAWELMGFGELQFDTDNVWRSDPISGHDWGTEYHADIPLARGDGSDVRVLWELNRLSHMLPLATAYDLTNDEKYAATFFTHIESWMAQNPYARGANWGCAMEVALRACNVLAAFDIFRSSKVLTYDRLQGLLTFFDHHGRFIVDNSEFSYIATSNHYLSDVIGLFWIGTLMPELVNAAEWREVGLREVLHEMDKQVLPDGADFEASTGYHRFVTEMFLHTFSLAEQNGIEVPAAHSQKLDSMFVYLSAITRPDGKMPMVGDCDGSRFVPFDGHNADDAQFLLKMAAIERSVSPDSAVFPDAGIYVLRQGDLYLHFNASDCGLNGRGSHGHNDALSIEVFASRPFIVDAGSYAYNLDLEARHAFRSTRYHSTVVVDDLEQNTIEEDRPFIIGNNAKPKLLDWSRTPHEETVSAEHYGYVRNKLEVIHRRTVTFNKAEGYWTVVDELLGDGLHKLDSTLHLAPGLMVTASENVIDLHDEAGRHLLVRRKGEASMRTEDSFFAPNYGLKVPTQTLVWEVEAALPAASSFVLVPASSENLRERLELIARIADNS